MAKSGAREGVRSGASTRAALVAAARATLVEEGFTRTSARAIAARAGCSQGSVFYHFPGVPELLLAVMDEVSDLRMTAYREPLLAARTPVKLARLGRQIVEDDIRSGDLRVLVEMIAGAASMPGMQGEVAKRIAPWEELVAQVAGRFIPGPLRSRLKPDVVAHAVVAGFLGMELLRDLRQDDSRANEVLNGLEQVGQLTGALPGTPS